MPLKALLIVDVQNDFITGSLRLDQCPAKEDGAEVVPVVNQLIEHGSFDVLAYTFDWHPPDHCSFFSNVKVYPVDSSINVEKLKLFDKVTFTKPTVMEQVLWPDHCLQNEWGAELHRDLRVGILTNIYIWDFKLSEGNTGLYQSIDVFAAKSC